MKKLETLAIRSNTINKKISANIQGMISINEKLDESSFEVYIYPDIEKDKLCLKIGKHEFIIDPNNEEEYKSEEEIEYIHCETKQGTVCLQITNIQGE